MEPSVAFYESFPLVFARCFGLAIVLPVREGLKGVVPVISFAAGLAVLISGSVPYEATASSISIGGEFVLGMLIGLPAALVVSIGAMLGELFDVGRGQNVGGLYDPISGVQQSHTALLAKSWVWAQLLLLGILEQLVGGLSRSFDVVSAGGFSVTQLQEVGYGIVRFLSPMLSGMMTAYFPFALAFLLLNCAMGFIGKVVPQLSLFGEVFQAKTYFGLAVMVYLLRSDFDATLLHVALPVRWMLPGG